jgi:uncharacterized protein YqeY
MDEAAMTSAVEAAIALTGAVGIKDMGKVVAALKESYPGQMDFAKASAIVKARLASG